MERERRVTAGKRMTVLVGQAGEDDEAFWGHDTWNDSADDEGNESFHSSDEDSELRKDEFDSDFDDSEVDQEEEEEEKGRLEEVELHKEEKKQRRTNYVDMASKASRAVALKKQKGKKSVTGDGLNAGIVLNLPSGPQAAGAPMAGAFPLGAATSFFKPPPPKLDQTRSIARTRQRRAITKPRRAAAQQQQQLKQKPSSKPSSSPVHKKKRKHQYTQEQLILEAVHETEPSNERWVLARKRHMDVEQTQEQIDRQQQQHKGKVVEKFVSRRGYLNVVSFPEMDHVPTILTQTSVPQPPKPTMCVITGKRARYLDPKTGHGYYDAAAFKELRRRHSAGERIQEPGHSTVPASEASHLPTAPSTASAPLAAAEEIQLFGTKPEKPSSATSTASSSLRLPPNIPTGPLDPTGPGSSATLKANGASDLKAAPIALMQSASLNLPPVPSTAPITLPSQTQQQASYGKVLQILRTPDTTNGNGQSRSEPAAALTATNGAATGVVQVVGRSTYDMAETDTLPTYLAARVPKKAPIHVAPGDESAQSLTVVDIDQALVPVAPHSSSSGAVARSTPNQPSFLVTTMTTTPLSTSKNTTASLSSPPPPRRSSPRQRKPSAKALQTPSK